MLTLAVEEPHLFVKVVGDGVWYTWFARDPEHSGFRLPAPEAGPAGFSYWSARSPDGWEWCLSELGRLGFAALPEAIAGGILPPGWALPAGADPDFGVVALAANQRPAEPGAAADGGGMTAFRDA